MTIGFSAAPLVLQRDQYCAVVSTLLEEKSQPSSYLAWGQALTTKSRKVFSDSKDSRWQKPDTNSVCVHGGLQQWRFIRWLAEPRLRFFVEQLHIPPLKATQNPSSSHRFILFQKWNRARQGTALKGLVESTKLLLFCRPVPLSYYFLLCLFTALLKTEYIFCCGVNKRLKRSLSLPAVSQN